MMRKAFNLIKFAKYQYSFKMEQATQVNFYEENEENGYLSNHWISPIVVKGKEYQTTEHFFQSFKPVEEEARERIRNAPTPEESMLMGREKGAFTFRSDWETVKLDIMYEG